MPSAVELEQAFAEFDTEGHGMIPIQKLRTVLTDLGDPLNGA